RLHLAAVMDLVIVEDDVNRPGVPIADGHQAMDEQEEQGAVLPLPLDPGELPRAGVEGAGEIALLILPRSRDGLLLTHQHPVRASRTRQSNSWVHVGLR